MLIVMQSQATPEQIDQVCERIVELGYTPHAMPGAGRTAIGVTGNAEPVPEERVRDLPGVAQTIRVTKPYRLVLREIREERTVVCVPRPQGGAPVEIGGDKSVAVMAGPCAVEGEKMICEIARNVATAGAVLLRGGAFKPRSSPYAFQGLGDQGLKYLARAREESGLPVVSEAVDVEGVAMLEDYVDMIQIGARNMQHFSLLKRVGRSSLPVLLKRGMSATLDELLQAAEYILAEGNYNVILCERGVRTFAGYTRNTLDLSAVPILKRLTHLPVIVDPSHATGIRSEVPPMACAAIAAGADGLMVEVHNQPENALSDGPQSLTPTGFDEMMTALRSIATTMGRPIG